MMKIKIILFFLLVSLFKAQTIFFSGNLPPDPYQKLDLDHSFQNVYYELKFAKNADKTELKTNAICILQIGKFKSKFCDLNAIKSDSLSEQYVKKESISGKEMNELLKYKSNWKNVYIKDLEKKINIVQDKAETTYQYEEEQPLFKWTIKNEKKSIIGYNCEKAVTTYKGRSYVAWYASDIPISNGPYSFNGLPGLILELYDDENNFHFTAVALDAKIQNIYIRNEESIYKTTRDKFLSHLKDYHENPGYYMGGSYDNSGNLIQSKLKPRPYNPIEIE